MQLNAFVVIVRKYGVDVHHHAPTNLNSARKVYEAYISQYIKPNGNFAICGLGNYDDKLIERSIIVFNNNFGMFRTFLLNIAATSRQNNITIHINHKYRAPVQI